MRWTLMRQLTLLLSLAIFAIASEPAKARPEMGQPMVVDLSNHLVAITTGFSGATVLLFGAVDGDGDVVVVVRGPRGQDVIRRKDRVMGIWVNRASADIRDVPAYYRYAATRPLEQLASPELLAHYQIGPERLPVSVIRHDKSQSDEDYRQALLRLKQADGLYTAQPGSISMMGGRLFRTEVDFPANVPTGAYQVDVMLLRGGKVVNIQTTPLIIGKIGVGAEVFDFANRQAALYGLVAVLLAAAAGWLAAVAFKRS